MQYPSANNICDKRLEAMNTRVQSHFCWGRARLAPGSILDDNYKTTDNMQMNLGQPYPHLICNKFIFKSIFSVADHDQLARSQVR